MIFNTQKHKLNSPLGIIDIGSSKLACIILLPTKSGKFELLGHSIHISEGIKNGEVIDMYKFSNVLGKTIQSAEEKASFTIKDINVVLSGGNPEIENCSLNIKLIDPIISKRELEKLFFKETNIITKENREIIQSYRTAYTVDDQNYIKNPLGMKGNKLISNVNFLTIKRSTKENIEEALMQNHLKIKNIHHTSSIAGFALLNSEEKELGVSIIDFGAETTSISVFYRGNIIYVDTIPIGGNHITKDIASILAIPKLDAERLKVIEGSLKAEKIIQNNVTFPFEGDNFIFSQSLNNDDVLHLTNGEVVQRELLHSIIRSRVDELSERIELSLKSYQLKSLFLKKLILIGGGSQLTNIKTYLEWKLNKFVVEGKLKNNVISKVEIPNDTFFSCIGMAVHSQIPEFQMHPLSRNRIPNFGIIGKSYNWFKNQILYN